MVLVANIFTSAPYGNREYGRRTSQGSDWVHPRRVGLSHYFSVWWHRSGTCHCLEIAIVLLPAVPVILGAGFLRLRVLMLAEQRQNRAYSSAAALDSEACKQNRIVAAYGLERHFCNKFDELLRMRFRQGLKFLVSSNPFLAFLLGITYFIYALAYWW